METQKNRQGLTDVQVAESRRRYGSNILTPPKRTPWWKEFLAKFADPLIVVLLVAGVLSVLISVYQYCALGKTWTVFFEPMGIFIAVILATGLSFIFEQRANRAFRVLNLVNDDEGVKVMRNGAVVEVPRKDIVVGDLVYIDAGDEIPADGVLVDSVKLSVDESTLTGEPQCHKTTVEADFDPQATYPSNHVLRGTKVMEGHGVMVVERVGDATESGKVFKDVQIDDSVRTPLDEQFDRLSKLITRFSYIIGILIVVGHSVMYAFTPGYVSYFTLDFGAWFLQSVMIAVTLIVCSVPEGLPMAVTLSLAYSMHRMLQTNNLVRRMHACETMGAATVICTDKTGTLTKNKMRVDETFFKENVRLAEEDMALNSTASIDESTEGAKVVGNPTEGALLIWLASQGKNAQEMRERSPRLAELPFTTERKYMATIVRSETLGMPVLYLKGAPEIVMGLCTEMAGGIDRDEAEAKLLQWQNQGMRTLGFAYAELPVMNDGEYEALLSDMAMKGFPLRFLGMVAISDQVREDVPAAVEECLNAGIDVKIVTGDTSATAREIGRRIGLVKEDDDVSTVITGPEVAAMTDEELQNRAGGFKIISRARPMDKKRLVEALQKNGAVVAVTGDGTNDAPALRAAHVGLSMGDGTSVAKEASDITIIDNSFSSIGRAVMWGRSLYKNIQRFLLFQLTVNVAACMLVLFGSFMGEESPLTVTQMLWINLIMDTFGAMALSSLPPTMKVMSEKPRDRMKSILTRPMAYEIIGVGGAFFLITIVLYWLFNHAHIDSVLGIFTAKLCGSHNMTPYEATLLFSVFVWTHFWYLFDARAFETGDSIFRCRMSSGFWTITTIIFCGQLFITEIAYRFFNVEPMIHTLDWKFNASGTVDLLLIIAASSLVVWVREVWLLFRRRAQDPRD